MVIRLHVVVLSGLMLLEVMPNSTSAESPASAEERARELFDEGTRLADEARWAEAVAAFRYSAELESRAVTSYNIANGLYHLERPVQALSELDRYDRMPAVLGDPAAQSRGASLRNLAEGATARIRVLSLPAQADIYIDGRLHSQGDTQEYVLVNPGKHSLQVRRVGYHAHLGDLEVEQGEQATVAIELVPILTSPSASSGPRESTIVVTRTAGPTSADSDRERFVKRPGFWVMIGAIVAVAVGTGVAIALTRDDSEPQCGTTGACATAGQRGLGR